MSVRETQEHRDGRPVPKNWFAAAAAARVQFLLLRLMGSWNQVAISAKGLGAPPFLVPGFRPRSIAWDDEADAEAEGALRAMLDGDELRIGEEAATVARSAATAA